MEARRLAGRRARPPGCDRRRARSRGERRPDGRRRTVHRGWRSLATRQPTGSPALMASSRRYIVSVGARSIEVEIRREGDRVTVLVDGESIEAQLSLPDAAGLRRLRLGGRAYALLLASDEGRCRL